jgi:hypothetical protein
VATRKVTDKELKSYIPMVESYIRKSVIKNWRESSTAKSKDDVMLGNTGMTMADIRQHLLMEVVVALQKYNPNHRTPEGLSVKESTFVFTHIFNRGGQFLKKVTKRRYGYGIWANQIEQVLGETQDNE